VTEEHVPSSPNFFRPVLSAMFAWLVVLAAAAVLAPAPLEQAADPAHAPNPAKAAWFLVWVQELVSHGTAWVYAVLALAVLLTTLPWLRRAPFAHASWFRRGERVLAAGVAGLALAVLVMTLIGLFFRGEQWRFVVPS
jgi:hypothetical protein